MCSKYLAAAYSYNNAMSSALLLASAHTYTCISNVLLYISSITATALHYFSFVNSILAVLNLCILLSVIQIEFCINLYKKPENCCTCCIVVGISHSFKYSTFDSLNYISSDEISKPRSIVILYKKLHFLSLH